MPHGGHNSESVRPGSGRQVRGNVRVQHSVDNNPRSGIDQNDRGEGDHEFHESPAVRRRGGGSYAGRGVVRDGGRPVEGAEDHADQFVHVEQDQVHVRADVGLRQEFRRSSVEDGRGDRVEEHAEQIHERRDREMRLRGLGRLYERARERILQVRPGGVPVGHVQAEFDNIRAQELAQVGQVVQPQDPARPHREVFLSVGGRDGGKQEEGRSARVGHVATIDGHAGEEGERERYERVEHSQSRVQLLLRKRGHDREPDKPDRSHAGRESRCPAEAAGRDRRGFVGVWGGEGEGGVRRYTRDEVFGRGDERDDEVPSDPGVHRQGVQQDFRIAAPPTRRPPLQGREGDERLVPRQSDPPRSEIFRESGEIRAGEISEGREEHR